MFRYITVRDLNSGCSFCVTGKLFSLAREMSGEYIKMQYMLMLLHICTAFRFFTEAIQLSLDGDDWILSQTAGNLTGELSVSINFMVPTWTKSVEKLLSFAYSEDKVNVLWSINIAEFYHRQGND